jgi:hypothetical protein
MAHMQPTDRYQEQIIFADADTTVKIQDPTSGGGPLAIGFVFKVVDNNGKAGTTNIALSGPINGGTTGTSITTNYGAATLTWIGNTFSQK